MGKKAEYVLNLVGTLDSSISLPSDPMRVTGTGQGVHANYFDLLYMN